MSNLYIDGDWITLDDRRVARLLDDLPHWLVAELRNHEGSPEQHHDGGYEAAKQDYNSGYEDGYAAAKRDALRDGIGA